MTYETVFQGKPLRFQISRRKDELDGRAELVISNNNSASPIYCKTRIFLSFVNQRQREGNAFIVYIAFCLPIVNMSSCNVYSILADIFY